MMNLAGGTLQIEGQLTRSSIQATSGLISFEMSRSMFVDVIVSKG